MNRSKHLDWPIPISLILLNAVPVIAGPVRLAQIGNGVVTTDTARFLHHPLPAVIHILSTSLYGVLGALQFAPSFRRRQHQWHRTAGKVLIPLGLASALSGLWMTLFYPWFNHDGLSLYVMRLFVGSIMTTFLGLGLVTIWRHDFVAHGRWMIRAYALGLGAGTQVLTHLPWFLFPSIQGEFSRALSMGLGWALNAVIAEWIIRTFPRPSQSRGMRSNLGPPPPA